MQASMLARVAGRWCTAARSVRRQRGGSCRRTCMQASMLACMHVCVCRGGYTQHTPTDPPTKQPPTHTPRTGACMQAGAGQGSREGAGAAAAARRQRPGAWPPNPKPSQPKPDTLRPKPYARRCSSCAPPTNRRIQSTCTFNLHVLAARPAGVCLCLHISIIHTH